jgi:outer membrane protein assembly factor BamE (lipoprotein component of BamABCDE complex)
MNHRVGVAFTAFLITLGGCALLSAPVLNPGETEADVIAKLGRPTHRFQDGSEHLLEYMHGPAGQETFIARFGANDRLISFQQVLTTVQFATLKVGSATKSDVLHAIGTPSETSYLARVGLEVWSYPYKENGVWDSMMHVHFDQDGIVRKMQNGPDPRRDPDSHWPFLR